MALWATPARKAATFRRGERLCERPYPASRRRPITTKAALGPVPINRNAESALILWCGAVGLMARIHLLYFDAGGGHRAAAEALAAAFSQGAAAGEAPRLVNLQDVLDSVDVIRRWTGIRLQDGYNRLVGRNWTWGFGFLVRPLQALIALRYKAVVAGLLDFWRRNPADLVVSLVPHFNGAIGAALQASGRRVPFAVVITDWADTPLGSRWLARRSGGPPRPSFWLYGSPELLVCGTPRAVAQALDRGLPPERVFQASGMILRPAFYANGGSLEMPRAERASPAGHRSPATERPTGATQTKSGRATALSPAECAAERERLGLVPGLPTALVLFGGAGSPAMLTIAAGLDQFDGRVQAIYICGRDQRLRRRLQARPARHPRLVLGFTADVPHYMQLADFFIGKPGPGALSEALQMTLPAIVVAGRRTMPQERFNADWLQQQGWGQAVKRPGEVRRAVAAWLRPGALEACRDRVAAVNNRAVFEIRDELRRRFLSSDDAAPPPPPVD